MLVALVGVVCHGDAPPSHHALVKVYYLVAVSFQLVHALLHTLPPISIFFLLICLDVLGELDPLPLDPVQAIHLSKQSWVDSAVAEVPVEEHAPMLEGDSAPQIQRLRAGQVVYVLLTQEAVPVSLSDGQLLVELCLPPGDNPLRVPLLESL